MKTLFKIIILMVAISISRQGIQAQTETVPPTILHFASDIKALSLVDIEAEQTSMTVNWTTVGIRSTDKLTIETLRLNQWQPLTDEDTQLLPQGNYTLIVRPSLTFAPPAYRLVIYNAQNQILDSYILTLAFAEQETESESDEEPPSPEIEVFNTTTTAVNSTDLTSGSVRVSVGWAIKNRLPGTNPIFEQVLPDGRAIPVEQPRPNLWIPSVGAGDVVPVMPSGENSVTEITLRMSLLDLVTNTILDSATLEIPVNTVVAVASPVPSPTTPPSSGGNVARNPQIISLVASPTQANYGDMVNVNWTIADVKHMKLEVTPRDRSAIPVFDGDVAHNSGTITFILPEGNYYRAVILMTVYNAAGRSTQQETVVFMNCQYPFFFAMSATADLCATEPAKQISAVIQYFQNGMMLWRSDTRLIYVLYYAESPPASVFTDTYSEGEDIGLTETPPQGLVAPQRGFGKVWVTNADVRTRLGWATQIEASYTMQLQPEAGTYSRSSIYRNYMTLPNGQVIFVYLNISNNLYAGNWGYLEQ